MSRSQMTTLRIYKDATTYLRWQNYFLDTSLSFLSQTFDYFPFEFSGYSESAAISDQGLSITLPATTVAIDALIAAQADLRVCEINVYEFSAFASQSVAPTSYTVIASHLGQILNLGGSFTTLTVGLGTALSPVGSQVPPRTYNTQLIGNPLRR